MKINLFYLLVIFIILNVRAYWLMLKDKRIAISNGENRNGGKRRTPEATLFKTALFYGFLGIGIGMLPPLRHKKNKLSFKIAIPTIAIVISALTFFILDYLHSEKYCDIYYDTGILFN